jgi:uncharacterized SAM-binding protein YcdF (DUF218 family)
MSTKVIVVLGATNSPSGELGTTAKERLNACVELFDKEDLILCTGGWGNHFNNSEQPHAFYAKEYLIKKGVENAAFLPFALSNNTVEDAVKIKEILAAILYEKLVIITSDFHLKRVQLIFDKIVKECTIEYCCVKSKMSKEERINIVKHENNALKKIQENGLYF